MANDPLRGHGHWLLAASALTAWAACASAGGTGTAMSTGTGGASCSGIVNDPTCDACLQASCCADLSACANDQDCLNCAYGNTDPTMPPCTSSDSFSSLSRCYDVHCKKACSPRSACNPVTNAGCTGDGEACDLDTGTMTFQCFPGSNATGALCTMCANASGPLCAPGLHCNDDANGTCTPFCCTDADCGSGTCDTTSVPSGVGVCTAMADGGTGGAPCDAPAKPPSGGTCYKP